MGHFKVFEPYQEEKIKTVFNTSNNCRRKKGKKSIITATIIRGNTVLYNIDTYKYNLQDCFYGMYWHATPPRRLIRTTSSYWNTAV